MGDHVGIPGVLHFLPFDTLLFNALLYLLLLQTNMHIFTFIRMLFALKITFGWLFAMLQRVYLLLLQTNMHIPSAWTFLLCITPVNSKKRIEGHFFHDPRSRAPYVY